MAMVALTMAKAIKTEMDSVTDGTSVPPIIDPDASDYVAAFDKAVKTYIEDNCQIAYSWSATLPSTPFTPDPVVSFTASVSFASFSTYTTYNEELPTTITTWASVFSTQILSGLIAPDDPTFLLPPMTFLSTTPLVITQSKATEYLLALTSVCTEVIAWIITLINPAAISGTHLTYTTPTPGAIMTTIL